MREPAKTPHAAQQRYLSYLQRSLSCLTNAVWVVAPPPGAKGEERALIVSEERTRLTCSAGTLFFYASQRFELIDDPRYSGEFKASTHGYIYSIYIDAPGENEAEELLSWHWHPISTPDRPQPHLHIRTEHPFLGVTLSRLHIPTGRVSFEEIVRFLIVELDAQPNRSDWEAVLRDSEDRFRAFRTWA